MTGYRKVLEVFVVKMRLDGFREKLQYVFPCTTITEYSRRSSSGSI
jgi:hypothetical protein